MRREIERRVRLWWWRRRLRKMDGLIITAAEQRREYQLCAGELLRFMRDVDRERSAVLARIIGLESPQKLISEATR